MHLTLHLTNRCNLACHYCYAQRGQADMTLATALQAIEQCAPPDHCGLVFFGGEPLLCQDLIFEIMAWCETNHPGRFHYKTSTNGILLDEAFWAKAAPTRLHVALSHDGLREAHDAHRVLRDSHGTFAILEERLPLLLQHRPYAPLLMTINPDTVRYFARSVQWFQARGVRYLIVSINYAAAWTDDTLKQLAKEYRILAGWHLENYRQGRKFYFAPFDRRIATHVFEHLDNSCRLGMRQISIGPDGVFYPCVQFVGRTKYTIGSIAQGLDEARRRAIFELNEKDKPTCTDCALRRRCHNKCGCLNIQATGDLCRIPAVLCEHERLVFPLADKLGAQLYKERNPLFLQRHYNPVYPILSYLEDISP